MSPVIFFLANWSTPRIWTIDGESAVPPIDDSSDWSAVASSCDSDEDRYQAYCDEKYESPEFGTTSR